MPQRNDCVDCIRGCPYPTPTIGSKDEEIGLVGLGTGILTQDIDVIKGVLTVCAGLLPCPGIITV